MKTVLFAILISSLPLLVVAENVVPLFSLSDEKVKSNLATDFVSPSLLVNDWYDLPPGLFGSVYAITVFDGSIYVAGNFLNAGYVPGANYIARWDGCQWHAEAPGMTGTIYEMVFIGGDIYVGGEFTDAGGNPDADMIAVWNGTQWNSLGSGLNGSVFAIAGNANGIYAGGMFLDAGGNPDADRIAKWNGSAWIPMGNGLNEIPYSIVIQGSQVFVGGSFTDAGGNNAADYIAQWNGNTWLDVGNGLNGGMWNMVVNGTDIYMIGSFTQAGGNPDANFIARWTGTEWQNVGDYFQPSNYVTINAITVADDYIYLGVSDVVGMAWVMQCDIANENWTEYPPYYPDFAPIGAIATDDTDIYVGNIATGGDDQGGGGDGDGCYGGFMSHHGSSPRGNGGILRWGEAAEQIIIEGVPGSICQNEDPLLLPPIQSGYPGNWSGPGVTDNTFDPENVGGWLALTFTPDQGPCPFPVTIDILVEVTVIDLQLPYSICDSDSPLELSVFQGPVVGDWSGLGVENNIFDPSGLSGMITLTFTPEPDQCAGIATDIIEVAELITPVISGVPESICETTEPINLLNVQDGIPGYWSGQGVNSNMFDPAGLNGSITLTFSPTTGTCIEIVTTDILVEDAIIPLISGIPNSLCQTDDAILLPEIQSGMNGIWSGPGVYANTFNPSGQSGNVSITFTPDDEQCATAASHIITINDVVIPIISGIPPILCENNNAIVLPVLQNGITGEWSGPGISNNTFNPNNFNGPVLFLFTSDANQCAGNTTFEIIVEPFIVTEITGVPPELCEADLPVALNTNQNGITGYWTGPGVMNNVFDPGGLNGTISLTFIPVDPCATIATTDINVLPALVPIAIGIPNTFCQSDESFPLPEMLQQITGDWSGPGVFNNIFNPNGQNGNIILTFTPENGQCAIPITISIVVSATTIPIITGIPTSLCHTDNELLLPEVISGITGNWSGQNVIANVFTPEGLNGIYNLQFSPDDGQCAQVASTEITIYTSPAFINLIADCDSTSQTYTVSFDIIEGDPSSYMVNGVHVGGTHFTSPPISSGNAEYLFTLNDVNGCGLVQIQGNLDCTCATFAGTMSFPGAPLKICEGSDFTVAFNGDANLDPDDVLGFVLHDQAGTQLGTVYSLSNNPAFTYPSGIVLGQVYYVSPIAGTNDGSGIIDLLDPCLSVSQGVPVIFYRPAVTVSSGESICPTECVTYIVGFSGEKPFEFLFQINADGSLIDSTLATELNQVELTICPTDYGLVHGILGIIPISMSDANCMITLSPGSENQTIVYPIYTSSFTQALCPGQTFVFNETLYDQAHTSGIETLQTVNGCDSLVEVNIYYYESALYAINQTLCFGGSMIINGTVYNESHPVGTEVIPGGSVNGCDSVITVQLNYNSFVSSNLTITLCKGESIYINGNTYDESNPTGTLIFPGGSVLGCDSVVNIQLSFYPLAESEITQTLCKGEWIEVNGTGYDETQPSGVEVMPNASVLGCDSVVNIQLSFLPPAESEILQTICKGEWIEVNGTVYDETQPSGVEVMPNASVLGCDSVVNIQLSFLPPAESEILQTICKGEWIEVNGTVYDETQPSGVEVLPNASALGCDSTVVVNLSFYAEAHGYVMDTLDAGKSIIINGIEYNQSNPAGIEVVPGGSVMGCDSIITITLHFRQVLSAIVQTVAPICHGESTGEIIVEEIAGGFPPYLISIDGGSQLSIDVFPVVMPGIPAGTYSLIIEDGLFNIIEFDLEIPEAPELTLDAGMDFQVEAGKDILLNVVASFQVVTWTWSPVDFLSCTDCPDPVVVGLDRDIMYTVIATDDKGCEASDDVQITILPEDELYVPTVFSPNGDGVNDTWRIYSSDQETQLISLSILDRWGSIIFNCSDRLLNDSGVEWDGYMKGGEMGAGVYVFVAVVKAGDQASQHIKGDITLIR